VKKLLFFLLLVGAALTGMAYWLFAPRSLTITERTFTYATADKGEMIEAVSATGVVEPRQVLWVTPQVAGTVLAIDGEVNELVSPERVLLKLDDRSYRLKWEEAKLGTEAAKAALDQALGQVEAAQINLKVQSDLKDKGGFRTDYELAAVQVRTAQKVVEAAKAQLAKAKNSEEQARDACLWTQVRAPHLSRNGGSVDTFLILERKVKIGQAIGPQMPFPAFVLTRDLENLQVIAQVAEGDIGRVKKGLTAEFTVTACSDSDIKFTGTVKEIRPTPANVKGAIFYDTVIDVANKVDDETGEWRLRPGMTASVDIIRRRHVNVWKIPTAALTFQMEEAYQSDAAKERVAEWKKRRDHADWQAVWIWDAERRSAWPLFVRIGGLKDNEPGLKDAEFNEVLEWEPGKEPAVATPYRLIINAPPASNPGIFDKPANIKLS
jgi:multidrug efflux pump subunit AcrA (membrane-fusion protein)